MRKGELTCSALFDFLGSDSKDIEELDHYLHCDVRHRWCLWDLNKNVEPSEEIFHVLEEVDKGVLACIEIPSCLRIINIIEPQKRG